MRRLIAATVGLVVIGAVGVVAASSPTPTTPPEWCRVSDLATGDDVTVQCYRDSVTTVAPSTPATTVAPTTSTTVAPTTTTTVAATTTVAPTTSTTTTTVAPSPGKRPDATNTGHDGNLTRTFGSTSITQAWLDTNNGGSRVVEDVRFTGQVSVNVDDVTIRNFAVTGGRYGVYNGVFTGNPTTGLVLEDGELTRQDSSGVLCSNCTMRRLHVHDQGADAFKPFSNYLIEDSYAHHLGYIAGSHSDAVQMVNGANGVIRGNHFDMPPVAGYTNSQVVLIQTGNGPINNVIVDGNWFNGGNYSVYVTDKGKGHGYPSNVEVTNNRFGRDFLYGPLNFKGGTPDVVSGNVWDDTGQPI